MATVMTAFPGQFTYRELLNLDFREFEFWGRKSQKVLLQEQLRMLMTVRAAMSEKEGFTAMKNELELRIRQTEIGTEAMIKESWDYLKRAQRL